MREQEKKLVTQVLQGEISPESHPQLFDEDIVYFAIRTLENHELNWVHQQLKTAKSKLGTERVLAALDPTHRPKQFAPKVSP